MNAVDFLFDLVEFWGWAGLLVAIAFLTVGIHRIDEAARSALAFRPLLVPGILLLWPLVLWRWWALETGRDDWRRGYRPPRRSHGYVWIATTLLLITVLALAISVRSDWPADVAPLQFEGGEATSDER